MRILIIEDNEKLVKSMETYLTHQNFTVGSAQDGELGLLYAEKNIYDIIILDWLLPEKDGISILHTIRKKRNSYTSYYGYCVGCFAG